MRKYGIAPNTTLATGALAVIVFCLLLVLMPSRDFAASVEVSPDAGGEGIQRALDQVGADGEVTLLAGTYVVRRPINLRRNGQTLRGVGTETILVLAGKANCPVLVLGDPMDKERVAIHGLHVSDLLVDGNRNQQTGELSRFLPDGTPLNNDGIFAWNTDNVIIERVTCCRCRSGGLVSSAQVVRLTVRDYTAYDNQFDGLACCLTEDSHFSQLNLHDNLAAGISVDLGFNHNVIEGAVLTGNDIGVFMRQSNSNTFDGVTICRSHHDGVFMAQTGHTTRFGWRLMPGSECAENVFNHLRVVDCGGRAFQVNNEGCTNNVINAGEFVDNVKGGLSRVGEKLVVVKGLVVHP